MALRFGFFNSVGGDRKYDARDMGELFNGVINDGVYMHIGNRLMVSPGDQGLKVVVGTGKSWAKGTWALLDAPQELTVDPPDGILHRIDSIVMVHDTTDTVRNCRLEVRKGQPSANPTPKAPVITDHIKELVLAHISVRSGTTKITGSMITNKVGSSETPFVTGATSIFNTDALISRWQSEWIEWRNQKTREHQDWLANEKEGVENFKSTLTRLEGDFDAWFSGVKNKMNGDVGTKLTKDVQDIIEREFKRFYGIVEVETAIRKNSSGKIDSIVETSADGVMTTTFSESGSGVGGSNPLTKTITQALVPKTGSWNYTKITKIKYTSSTLTNVSESVSRTAK